MQLVTHIGRVANHSATCPTPEKYVYPSHWMAARHCVFLNGRWVREGKPENHQEPYQCYGCHQWHIRNTGKNQRRYESTDTPISE